MANNKNLHSAKAAKNDEFYTQLTDIEKEMMHYRDFFNGKVVFCNCNDALHSNFAKYFSLNFEFLGLKKLICTAYKVDGEHGKVCIYEGDKNGNKVPDLDEWECKMLSGDGGFASEECIEFLKECDVVVTNPPFSLFREYVKCLMDYGKKFIIMANKNAITYKEIFPYIKNNELWNGYTSLNGGRWMIMPNDIDITSTKAKENGFGEKVLNVAGVCWFTNVMHPHRSTPLDLYKRYNAEEYPKYDNYDAIEVSKVCEIPMDYDGVMGVPITFLDKYCPTQFEIIDLNPHFFSLIEQGFSKPKQLTLKNVGKRDPYARVLIKRVS